MQFIDLKIHQEKIDDFRFVIASAAKRSIHMVLDCHSCIRSFAMTPFSDCRSRIRPFAMTHVVHLSEDFVEWYKEYGG
jgi:succinylglutamate desuccinylase